MMAHLVTICTFLPESGSNFFGHTGIILSVLDKQTNQVRVIDALGFYGVPAADTSTHWYTQLLKLLSLDLDISGNHGWLIHEEIRFMDLGQGLCGNTFELTEEEFNHLQEECDKRLTLQQQAVDEYAKEHHLEGNSSKQIKRYLHEKYSRIIFAEEKNKAKENGTEPRLKPFDFILSWNSWRPTLLTSHTCKTEAVDILKTVLSDAEIKPYLAHTFPRAVSGGMEYIYLHSSGPLKEHIKESQQRVYFRDRETPGVKLTWTIPPQNISALPESKIKSLFAIDEEYCDEVKALASKLQRLEWLFRNAEFSAEHEWCRGKLLARIIAGYRTFSVCQTAGKDEKPSGVRGLAFWLMSIPKNKEQKNWQEKINKGNFLINCLYTAITEGWRFEQGMATNNNPYTLGILASYLSVSEQKKLCQIINRTYVSPELLAHDEHEYDELALDSHAEEDYFQPALFG
ncbi:MAG: hypothetical protein QM652_09110 [Legionella sp.]|uniref:hypothetical protein n=1 Tax=Legionella sp. TaxID=459 RepID=UPI0039E47D57